MKIIHHFYRELKGKGADILAALKGKEPHLSLYVMSHYATTNCTLFLLSNTHLHAKFKD